ncbi:MAG: hypothetical protein ACLQVA_18870 [Candidatus Brocadiia bacterium]
MALEETLSGCRPDIVLYDSDGKVVSLIEVIVSHEPEEGVYRFCQHNKVILIEYRLNSPEDLEAIKGNSEFKPSFVDLCITPKCPACQSPLYERKLCIVDRKCWSCGTVMKAAVIGVAGYEFNPEQFSPSERELAEKLGAWLRFNYSHTVGHKYLSNTCHQCGKLLGDHYLHVEIGEEEQGRTTGFHCFECDKDFAELPGNL